MEEKKLVPKRRYQGFTEKWDKSKLENLAGFSKGKGYSKKDLTDIGHQLILYGRLYTNYETVIRNVDTYTIKQENSMLSKGREVIVPSSGETKEDIARASAILEPNIIIGGDLNVIIPSNELDSVFLALNISNGSCQSELMKRAQGSSVVHLYNEDLISVTLHFPSVKEQQRIGAFFKVLDERIANQERKVAKIKALKSAYLTEMFPQEGETIPKRRFKGFEGEWKEIKLEELTEITTGYAFSSRDFSESGKYAVFTNKNIEDQDKGILTSSDRINISDQSIVEKYKLDDINVLVSMDGNVGKTRKFTSENAVIAQRVGRLNSDQIEFVYQVTKRDDFIKALDNVSVGNIIKHISLKQIGEYTFYAPVFENEQQKIGEFFKNLDDQIEMEEKKLDKLQKMKEAYLEEMFV